MAGPSTNVIQPNVNPSDNKAIAKRLELEIAPTV